MRLAEEVEALQRRGEFPTAERLVLSERERQPGRIDLLVLHAELAMSARDWPRAVDRWRRLLEGFGDGAPEEVQARLATALRSSGDLQGAIDVVERAGAARTASGRVALAFEDAANLMASGDLSSSVVHWRRLLQDPDLPMALLPVVREALTSSQRSSGVTPDPDLHPELLLPLDHGRLETIRAAPSVKQDRGARDMTALRTTVIVLSQGDPARLARTRDGILGWRDPSIDVRVVPLASGATAVEAARRAAGGQALMLVEEGVLIDRDALDAAREVLVEDPAVAMVAADEDSIDDSGNAVWPLLRSSFDPDLLLTQPSLGNAVLFRGAVVDEVGGFLDLPIAPRRGEHEPLLWCWDLALRVMLRDSVVPAHRATVGRHLPSTLLHRPLAGPTDWTVGPSWTEEGPAAAALVGERLREADAGLVVRPAYWGAPLHVRAVHDDRRVGVSIVIPTRDRAQMLAACVEGLLDRTSCSGEPGLLGIDLDVELVLVDNDSVEDDAVALLTRLGGDPRVTIVPGPGEFNFSRLVNAGVAASSGEVIVLLNNDVVVQNAGWLLELVAHALRPEIGAVGALLQHEDGRVQHAGVLVGVNGTAEHAFREWPSDAAGYLALLRSTRRVSAVTAACLAIRREVYTQVGGLDESALPVELNDVDLCLRVEEAGLSILWTPFARLSHIEGGTRGRGDGVRRTTDGGVIERQEAQRSAFIDRWRDRLNGDPFYSPRLSTSGATYLLRR